MAIKFKAIARKSPVDKSISYYPIQAKPEPVTLDRIVKQIEENSTMHESDIKGVIANFYRRIIEHLQDGRSVNLEDLGSFNVWMKGKGEPTAEEVQAESIKSIRVAWRPSAVIRKQVKLGADGIRFERVKSIYEKEEE